MCCTVMTIAAPRAERASPSPPPAAAGSCKGPAAVCGDHRRLLRRHHLPSRPCWITARSTAATRDSSSTPPPSSTRTTAGSGTGLVHAFAAASRSPAPQKPEQAHRRSWRLLAGRCCPLRPKNSHREDAAVPSLSHLLCRAWAPPRCNRVTNPPASGGAARRPLPRGWSSLPPPSCRRTAAVATCSCHRDWLRRRSWYRCSGGGGAAAPRRRRSGTAEGEEDEPPPPGPASSLCAAAAADIALSIRGCCGPAAPGMDTGGKCMVNPPRILLINSVVCVAAGGRA